MAAGLLRGFALFILAFEILYGLTRQGAGLAERLTSVFLVVLVLASLAYLLYVAPKVSLDYPGIDERDMEGEDDGSTTGKEGKHHMAKALLGKLRKKQALHDATITLQVSRLASTTTPIMVRNASTLPVLRAETSFVLEQDPEDAGGTNELATQHVRGKALSLPAHSACAISTAAVFNHVGIFTLGTEGVRVRDLLGLFASTRGAQGTWRVRVVPNIYRLTRGVPRDRGALQSDLGIPDTPSDALDYDRVRDYRPGDPLKTVHWKLVAHGQGELYTKLFETATFSSVTLVIDPFGPPTRGITRDRAFGLYDTMLEGGFSLLEHAREVGLVGRMRFAARSGGILDTRWEGPASLGWFVETAKRPAQVQVSLAQSVASIQALARGSVGYAIVATSWLCEESVGALIACHHRGVSLLVVHALPHTYEAAASTQRAFDDRLRQAAINVVGIEDGPQIVREVTV